MKTLGFRPESCFVQLVGKRFLLSGASFPGYRCTASISILEGVNPGELEAGASNISSKAADLDKDADLLQWWKNHSNDLPYWPAAAEKILLVQPSSVFSSCRKSFLLLQNSFKWSDR